MTELELIQRLYEGDHTAAAKLLELWGLPNTKAGAREAGRMIAILYPDAPKAITWNDTNPDQTALDLFANT